MRKLIVTAVIIYLSMMGLAYANPKAPEGLAFKDNQQLAITLSRVDMNRLQVKGDQITELTYPSGFCTDKQGTDGATFLTIHVNEPFTLYIATKAGHHFSVLITPKAIVGKTVLFIPNSPSKQARHWERSETYQHVLVDLMRDMMLAQNPSGYSKKRLPSKKSYALGHHLYLTPLADYQGAHLTGIVYRIQNHSKQSITLSPNEFYADNVRAVALSTQTLKPFALGYVYEIVSSTGERP